MCASASAERIGILGGTFNPVHMGHLVLAQDALEQLGLAYVFFVPSGMPPHKPASGVIAAEHRLAMLSAAMDDNPHFCVSEVEVARAGVSYTIDTVRHFRALHPGSDLHFIVGSDTLPELHTWRDIQTLLGLCTFATALRPGYDLAQMTDERLKLASPWPARLRANAFSGHYVDISSSDIRHRVAEGMSIRYLVPAAVEMYIAEHHLYED